MFRLLSAVGGGHIRIWTIHYGHAFVCRSTSPVVLATVAVSFFYQREVAHSLYHFPQCRPLRFSPLSSGMACCRNARLSLFAKLLVVGVAIHRFIWKPCYPDALSTPKTRRRWNHHVH